MSKKLKILHIGNIAGNAYLNAKFLRGQGLVVDVISHDYSDLISSPEWFDARTQEKDVSEILKTGNTKNIDLKFKRPSWYISGSLEEISKKYGYSYIFSVLLIQKNFANHFFKKRVGNLNYLWLKICQRFNPYWQIMSIKEYHYYQSLIKKFSKFFPERSDQLTIQDIIPYTNAVRAFKHIFEKYNLVQAYATEPIYTLLANKRPYIAYEHGTIRDLPFEDSAQGRLTALAYRMADFVLITNPDNIRAAKKLNLKKFNSIPHPITEKWVKEKIKMPKDKSFNLFCPSRHDWDMKNTHYFIHAFAKILKKTKKPVTLILVKWGSNIKKSQSLIKKLGIEKHVKWIELTPKNLYFQNIARSNVVLDQVYWVGMGGIVPEAMLFGKPVLVSYDAKLCQWMFPDPPPVLSVFTIDDIYKTIVDLLEKPKKAKEIGKEGQKWFNKYHSKKIIVKKHLEIYKKLLKGI